MGQLVPWGSIEAQQLDQGLTPHLSTEEELRAPAQVCADDYTPLVTVTFLARDGWDKPATGRLQFRVCPICSKWQLAADAQPIVPIVTHEGRPYRLDR